MMLTNRTHFSRVTLNRHAAAVAPLAQVLMPEDAGDAAFVHHRLLWTLFAKGEDKPMQADPTDRAPFLWRRLDYIPRCDRLRRDFFRWC